jgi:hypothetical protein
VIGGNFIPQRVFLGQNSPQTAVTVWLHGMREAIDVTGRHTMACADPFTLCLAFSNNQGPSEKESQRLTLTFCEQGNRNHVLAEIGLKLSERVTLDGMEFLLFNVRSTANYCVPTYRLWAHYLLYARANRITDHTDIHPTFLERRAMEIMFLCPRPIGLMSALTDIKGNMFPVNVMGDIDKDYFTFSLKQGKMPAQLVENSGRVAMSSVPLEQGSIAYRLGVNHNKKFINWYELPFETQKSEHFQIPVPAFAYRVREMEVQKILRLGSHTCFIARVVSDTTYTDGKELFVVHGFYEAWRLKENAGGWGATLAEDARVKAEPPVKSSAI